MKKCHVLFLVFFCLGFIVAGSALAQNQAPVADAGPDQTVPSNVVVYLDGSGSTDDTTLTNDLTYYWTWDYYCSPKEPCRALPVLLPSNTVQSPTFTTNTGTFSVPLLLVVTDADGVSSVADSCLITITGPNANPRAVAGPDQSIRTGDIAYLDGFKSSDDNTDTLDLIFEWTLGKKPVGSTAYFSSSDPGKIKLHTDLDGTYAVSLVVEDEYGLKSRPDSVFISTAGINMAPTAVPIPDNALIEVGAQGIINGLSSTDPEGDKISYSWELTPTAGSAAVLDNPVWPVVSFIADIPGEYTVTLTASDFLGAGDPVSTTVTAVSAEDLAQIVILDAGVSLTELSAGAVTTGGNQNALMNSLTQAAAAIEDGDVQKAITKLTAAIERTDGCILRGEPDGNGHGRDWVTNCEAQYELYDLLNTALEAITP